MSLHICLNLRNELLQGEAIIPYVCTMHLAILVCRYHKKFTSLKYYKLNHLSTSLNIVLNAILMRSEITEFQIDGSVQNSTIVYALSTPHYLFQMKVKTVL